MREKITILSFLTCIALVKCSTKCRTIDPKDHHFRSVVFAEAHGVGLGSQLFVYALMSQLRAEHNLETFVSAECRAILSKVFTMTSLSDVPVFEETFCVEHPSLVGHFEGYTRDVQDLVNKSEYARGRLLWLWPHKEKQQKRPKEKSHTVVPYTANNPLMQGYRPEEHTSHVHNELMSGYKKRLSQRLRFTSQIKNRGDQIFDSIAKTLELKRKDVTFVGIHNRRADDYSKWVKKNMKKNPFKKKFFYDAMEDFRDSYENVAFLYVSDDMDWARKNLKDKEHDLFFVGDGDLENPGLDLSLLARSNHTVMTRGAFSSWAANLAGGECYTEYGSIVPDSVMDKIEEETAKELRRQNDQQPPGSASFNMDADDIEILPTMISQEIESFGSIIESWLHNIFTMFY